AAAKNSLLTEQIGFALFLEGGFDNARTAATNARSVRQSEIMCVARSILMDRDKARNAAALLVFAANCMAWALWCDHDNVNGLLWLDEAEVNIEAVCECNRCAVTDVILNVILVDVSLKFIRGCHHKEIAPLGGISNIHDFK